MTIAVPCDEVPRGPNIVPPQPSMDAAGLKYFQESANRSKCYLEYGSGGSTVYAANIAQVPIIISVESDRAWSEKVRASISAARAGIFLEHCDIGEVGEWGTPKNKNKIENFWRYAVTPWQAAIRNNLIPDMVLIDGRFRVASFLFTLVAARIGTPILFDDYFDRPHYFVAEQFCNVEEKRGRMGVFFAARSFSAPEICERIAQYSVQWG